MFLTIDFKIIFIVAALIIVLLCLIIVAIKQFQKYNEKLQKNQDVNPKYRNLDSLSKEQKDFFGLKRNEYEENPDTVVMFDGKEKETIDTSTEVFTYNPEFMPADFEKKEAPKSAPIEFDAEDDEIALSSNEVDGLPNIKYRKSMLAKVLLGSDLLKENYTSLKNNLLSLKDVTAKMIFQEEQFFHDSTMIAKVNARGQYVYMYIALEPQKYINPNYMMIDVSFERKYVNVPTLIKIKNQRDLNYAMLLIKNLGIDYGKMVDNDYQLATIDEWELLRRGLLK